MKTIRNIFMLCVLIMWSCETDVFDRQPLDKMSDQMVWQNEAMIRANATNLYTRLTYFSVPTNLGPGILTFSDEATYNESNATPVTTGGMSRTNDPLPFWNYTLIRDMSTFIEKIATAPITEGAKNQMEGEVRAMRAYTYFEMQKRYGGVPLVDVPLDPFSGIDTKYTMRSKEEAIADFIDAEFVKAIGLLTDNPIPRGRINKWTAYGFKARANLWAASIAKFGTVQLDGLVGIPAERADEFYAKASAAAEAVISSGNYSLYDKFSDKSENYRKLFVDDNNNPEVIFQRVYDGVNLTHNWDYHTSPATFSPHGATLNPVLEFLLGYENMDGSPDQPAFGPENLYDNGSAPFMNKDPRLLGSVFFQGDDWQGKTIETYEGIDPGLVPNSDNVLSEASGTYQGIPMVGYASRNISERHKAARTGFLPKKYETEAAYVNSNESSTNWKILRLAEMYLIKAEAEFERGTDLLAAANALNATRSRAGISLVDQSTITRDHVRNEWRYEMSFEGNRYYDLRRWRVAEEELNGAEFKGLRIILHYETGKYYFVPIDLVEGFTRVFRPEQYYNPITDARINNNPDLIENPLY